MDMKWVRICSRYVQQVATICIKLTQSVVTSRVFSEPCTKIRTFKNVTERFSVTEYVYHVQAVILSAPRITSDTGLDVELGLTS